MSKKENIRQLPIGHAPTEEDKKQQAARALAQKRISIAEMVLAGICRGATFNNVSGPAAVDIAFAMADRYMEVAFGIPQDSEK